VRTSEGRPCSTGERKASVVAYEGSPIWNMFLSELASRSAAPPARDTAPAQPRAGASLGAPWRRGNVAREHSLGDGDPDDPILF
jgi:hypothetical protein